MGDSLKQILIEHKLSYLQTVAETTMTWWMSSILLCISMIGFFWLYRKNILGQSIYKVIVFAITIFLLTFPVYSYIIIKGIKNIRMDLEKLIIPCSFESFNFSEFDYTLKAIACGGYVFVFMVFIWISFILPFLNKLHKKRKRRNS